MIWPVRCGSVRAFYPLHPLPELSRSFAGRGSSPVPAPPPSLSTPSSVCHAIGAGWNHSHRQAGATHWHDGELAPRDRRRGGYLAAAPSPWVRLSAGRRQAAHPSHHPRHLSLRRRRGPAQQHLYEPSRRRRLKSSIVARPSRPPRQCPRMWRPAGPAGGCVRRCGGLPSSRLPAWIQRGQAAMVPSLHLLHASCLLPLAPHQMPG